jgi:hypothetical protein
LSRTPHKCTAGCGKVITWRFAICSDCEEKYGKSARNWPDWLRTRWNMIQRERRQDKRVISHEIESGLNDEVFNVKQYHNTN